MERSSALAACLLLFVMPFAHEDAAVVTGAALIVEGELPAWLAALALIAGTIASDVGIYALGGLARRIPWLRKRLVGERVERLREGLGSHLPASVALCHLLPGVLFPTFLACGWFRLPFTRFAIASAGAALIYVPLALAVATLLGATVLRRIGIWAWVLFLVAVAVVSLRGSLRQVWAGLVVAGDRLAHVHPPLRPAMDRDRTHQGMPSLVNLARRISRSERFPTTLYYVPLALRWIRLGVRYGSLTLPTLADPTVEAGGLWGESKSELMRQIRPEHWHWIAHFVTVRRSESTDDTLRRVSQLAHSAGLAFPLVAKPDLGWQGRGVRRIDAASELEPYLAQFPVGETIILQRYVPYDGEAGVYYARHPQAQEGAIIGLAFRYFPHVVGDGRSPLRSLVAADARARFKAHYHLGGARDHLGLSAAELDAVPPAGSVVRLSFIGSIRVGGLYRDAREHITPALTRRFDAIARGMNEFYFGRFDIRFASVERLRDGEDFAIIEVNGAGSEPIQVWDPERSIASAYRELFRFQSLLFEIAAENRSRGYTPMPVRELLRLTWRYNRLLDAYPASS